MRRKNWPRKSGLGLGLGVGGGGYEGALYQGATWTYTPATGIWVNTPNTTGAELISNGGFDAWGAGAFDNDPNNWTVTAEDANNRVTENPAGKANLVSDASAAVNFTQNYVLAINKFFILTFDITVNVNGGRFWVQHSTIALQDVTSSQLITRVSRINGAFPKIQLIRKVVGASDVIYDNISVKELNSSTLYNKRNCGSQKSISALATVVTGHAGVITRYSDNDNYLLGYYDINEGKASLWKKVAGSWTELIPPTAVVYGAWKSIEIRLPAANTAQLYYDGSQVGGNIDLTTAPAVPSGAYAGIFSTSPNNSLKTIVLS